VCGEDGSTLTHDFAAGHEVVSANFREPQTLSGLVDRLGGWVRAVTAEEAARFGEVVFVSVPFGRHRQLQSDGLAGKMSSTPSTTLLNETGRM
jgi:8-hydroxy-5-deazaflavin:NADPH oxidoreductase